MLFRIFATLLLASCATFASADSALVSQTIILHYIAAGSVPSVIKSTQQLDTLTCNYHDNSVTATGTSDNLAAFASEIRKNDVPRKVYQFAFHLTNFQMSKRGELIPQASKEPTVPVITTVVGTPASISFREDRGPGLTVQVTALPKDENELNINTAITVYGDYGQILYAGTNTRDVPISATTRVTGATNCVNQAICRDVQLGKTVSAPGDYSGVYVDVTPNLAN